MAVVMFAVVVLAGLAGFGGARRTGAVSTDTEAITGNTFGTATLEPPTALVVAPGAGGSMVLTWAATSSGLTTGIPYTYTVTAVGPGTV